MSEPVLNPAVDPDAGLDPMAYAHQVLDPDKVLTALGFTYGGEDGYAGKTAYWTKKLTPRIFLTVNFNEKAEVFNFRKVRLANPRKFSGAFKILDAAFGITLAELKAKLAQPEVHMTEGQELVRRLLDNDPDALEPWGELDRLLPGRCPECGSFNVSPPDRVEAPNIADCYNCGGYFTVNQPVEEAFDPDDPAEFISRMPVLSPRICITFSQTTPESSEQGDYSDSGWIDEEGKSMEPDEFDREERLTAADLAVKFLQDEGVMEPSSSDFYPGVWYSTEWHTVNYRTGTDEERSYHLRDFSEAEEKAIWDGLHAGWNRRRRPH
jgi:hypothetical protein